MAKQGPCWDGYVQRGFKMKNGKKVPNCVPIGSKRGNKNARQKNKV